MGPRCVPDRTGERLFRRHPPCMASGGRCGPVEGRWDFSVSTWFFCSSPICPYNSAQRRLIGVPSSTCYMLTYDHLLNVVLPPLLPQPMVPLSAGILARTTITSLMSPLELVRTNLQSTPPSPDNPHTLRSVLTSVRSIAQTRGWHCLWRGLGPTLWRDVPFSGLYWAGYESCKRNFEARGHTGAGVAFASGAISGTTAALLTSPFDVLKTRRQAMLMSATSKTTSSIPLLLEIVRTEGVSTLYAGIVPRITKIAPACGIMIACFEVR